MGPSRSRISTSRTAARIACRESDPRWRARPRWSRWSRGGFEGPDTSDTLPACGSAVVGAGPAGLTAAYRLQAAGHEAIVLEAGATPGGRTRTTHFGPGHWTDDGAGWFGSFYPDSLSLLDELGLRDRLRVLHLRGGGDLLVDGRLRPNPNSVRRILTTGLLSPVDKVRFLTWMARLFLTQPGNLRIDDRQDPRSAEETLRSAGTAAAQWVVLPSFEVPSSPASRSLSVALVRSWMRALSVAPLPGGRGMDSPWRTSANGWACAPARPWSVSRQSRVASNRDRWRHGVIRRRGRGGTGSSRRGHCGPGGPAGAVGEVEYAPHVRLYLARRGVGSPRSGIHAFPNETVATVELGNGGDGSWGRVPAGWEWALICAPAASSGALLELADDELAARLWAAGSKIDDRLFPLESAEIGAWSDGGMRCRRWASAISAGSISCHSARPSCSPGIGWCSPVSKARSVPGTPLLPRWTAKA